MIRISEERGTVDIFRADLPPSAVGESRAPSPSGVVSRRLEELDHGEMSGGEVGVSVGEMSRVSKFLRIEFYHKRSESQRLDDERAATKHGGRSSAGLGVVEQHRNAWASNQTVRQHCSTSGRTRSLIVFHQYHVAFSDA